MIEQLIEAGIRCYQGPYNNDYTGFDPTYHQVIFFDEFKGQVTIQDLNALCDKHTRLNAKYGGIIKTNKVLVIILSNFTINDCYRNAVAKDGNITEPVHARFRMIPITRRQPLK